MTQLDYGPARRGATSFLLVDRLGDDRTDRRAGGGADRTAEDGAGDRARRGALFDVVTTGRQGQGDGVGHLLLATAARMASATMS